MKIVTAAAIAVFSLAPAAVVSAADQSVGGSGAAAAGTPATGRDAYLRTVQQEMRDWQGKLRDAGETAVAGGRQAGSAAEAGLHDAWTKTEAASHRLQTASTEGWDGAKASYEEAARDLAAAWHRVHPDK